MDLLVLLENEELLATKSLGAVCVAVVERSTHTKGRALAYRLCAKCVEKDGLAGIGKRGVLALAKSLSEESMPENKAAALEVMVLILSKMNGDIQRLVRVCGEYLTDKGRQLLEDRWEKSDRRGDNHERRAIGIDISTATTTTTAAPQIGSSVTRHSHASLPPGKTSEFSNQAPTSVYSSNNMNSAAGTAAVLRARLLKIREMSKPTEDSGGFVGSASLRQDPVPISGMELFDECIKRLQFLKSLLPPLDENDDNLLAAIDSLKRFHAALSKQQTPGVRLSEIQLVQLREQLIHHLHEAAQPITR